MPLQEELRHTDTVFSIPLCKKGGDHKILFFHEIGDQVVILPPKKSSGVLYTNPCPACKFALQVEFRVENPDQTGWKTVSPVVDLVAPMSGRLLN